MSPATRVYVAAFCVGLILGRVLMAAAALDQPEHDSEVTP